MAVRNDFAAGEVLAAADLNDTFASKADYPSGGTDGQALLKSGTTTAWGAAGALVLIDSVALSGSSVSLNGCFTSTYEDYLLSVQVKTSSTQTISFRGRASGVDDTGSVYYTEELSANGTTVSAQRVSTTSARFGVGRTTEIGFSVYLSGPQLAQRTNHQTVQTSYSGGTVSSAELLVLAGVIDTATQYDGFTFFPAAGTFSSGRIWVYGLQKGA